MEVCYQNPFHVMMFRSSDKIGCNKHEYYALLAPEKMEAQIRVLTCFQDSRSANDRARDRRHVRGPGSHGSDLRTPLGVSIEPLHRQNAWRSLSAESGEHSKGTLQALF